MKVKAKRPPRNLEEYLRRTVRLPRGSMYKLFQTSSQPSGWVWAASLMIKKRFVPSEYPLKGNSVISELSSQKLYPASVDGSLYYTVKLFDYPSPLVKIYTTHPEPRSFFVDARLYGWIAKRLGEDFEVKAIDDKKFIAFVKEGLLVAALAGVEMAWYEDRRVFRVNPSRRKISMPQISPTPISVEGIFLNKDTYFLYRKRPIAAYEAEDKYITKDFLLTCQDEKAVCEFFDISPAQLRELKWLGAIKEIDLR